MEEKEIILNNKKFFYRKVGEGAVVVLLHGFGEDGSIWSNQYNALNSFQLIIPDLPGSGRSEMIDDMSMEGLAEWLKEFIQAVSPHQTSPNGEGLANTQPSLTENANNLSASLKSGDGAIDFPLLGEPKGAEFYYEADPVTYKLLKNFVSEHRRSPTQAEIFLWEQLRGNKVDGYSFRRQHIIGNFIVDFVCLAKKLIIEVDGVIHQLPENKISDEERTAWLEMKGYTVIRFSNEEVLFHTENTLNGIKQKLHELPFAEKKNYASSTIDDPKKNNDIRPGKDSAADSSPVGGSRMGIKQKLHELPFAEKKNYASSTIDDPKKNNDIRPGKDSAADSSPVGGSRMGAFTLIGHSMGGYITLAFAEKHPELLNGFGLFHSSAYADSEEKKETRKKGIEFIEKHGAFEFLKTSTPNLYSPVTKKERPQLIEEQIAGSNNFSGAALVSYYRSMMARPDRTGVLKNSRLPVLFILGKYDNAVPLKDGLEQCSLPDLAYIHVLESSGHMGMREEPEESNPILLNYLKNLHHQAQ